MWGQAHLAAIPARGGVIAKSCRTAQDIADFLEANKDHNFYFTVNPCKPINSKATKQHIRRVDWAHVDIDAKPGAPLADELARLRNVINKAAQELTPPHVIIFSGGGYQLFWKLSKSLKTAQGEAVCKILAKRLGGDKCHNCDRIMRLPFTTNYPSLKKQRDGRLPTQAELVRSDWQSRVEAKDLVINSLPPSLREGALQTQGNSPTRSEHLFKWIIKARQVGIEEDLLAFILMQQVPIAESILDKPRPTEYLARQLERTRQVANENQNSTAPGIAEVNRRYALIKEYGGKALILGNLDRPDLVPSLQKVQDFLIAHKNIQITEKKSLGQVWIEDPARRDYDGLIFNPSLNSGEVSDVGRKFYNTWSGFAVEPQEGDGYLPFKEHLAENVCNGDGELFNYLWCWLARCVQQPHIPAETAIVLQGAQGVGKTFVGEQFGKLLGRHKLIISHSHHLTGNFNSHLRDIVLLVAEEAFFAGDKRHEGVLKTLITGQTLAIEAKGIDVVNSFNRLHIMLTSNEDWVVPVSVGDRRFCVARVRPSRRRDKEYFGHISRSLDNGGLSHLLSALLDVNLEGFNPLELPETAARKQQAERTLEPDRRWWADLLAKGVLYSMPEAGGEWPEGCVVDTQRLYKDYVETCAAARLPRLLMFGDWLARWARGGGLDNEGKLNPLQIARANFWGFVNSGGDE